MPLSYWVDEQLNVFFLKGEGHLTADELLRFIANRATEAPRDLDTVVDLSEVTDLALSPEQVLWIARGRRDRSRLAIVATRPLIAGVSRMFRVHADAAGQKSEISIFASREEAVAWLRAGHGEAAGQEG